MKTQKSTIDFFANDAMTVNEMVFIRGGGDDSPIDFIIPPTKPDEDE
jgi:hypothetical protein